jgi:hypothetical protein
VKDFRVLKVWEKAHRLTLDVYKTTARFPREELYGLTRMLTSLLQKVDNDRFAEC